MGFFNLFKRNIKSKQANIQQAKPIDNNLYLLDTFKNKLNELGYQAIRHPQLFALVINDNIEITTVIIDNPNNHPDIIHLMILTVQPDYFPEGIKENIAGIGTTLQDKVNAVIDNYINTTFLPIMDSLSDSHNPELDFSTRINDKEVLWHPQLGNLTLQGRWDEHPSNEPFFEIIRNKIQDKLTSNKINWLKLYVSKQADGTIIGECNFNNEPWEEGLKDITTYATTWEMKSKFKGLKQFIIFRRCDAYDN